MIIQFSETEFRNMTFHTAARRERLSTYLKERELIWAAQMEKVLARKDQMWNGEIYTLEEIQSPMDGQIILRISTCEYKDLVFHAVKGPEYIAKRFGMVNRINFMGVTCVPVTVDGKYVFGIRSDRAEPTLGGIGGSLNKDEMEIGSFADIRRFILREIQEETALECREDDLQFVGLIVAGSMNQFWFTLHLPFHSEDANQFHRSGEFSSLIAITQKEALESKLPMRVEVRSALFYLHWLPFILDGMQPGIHSV